MDTATDENSRIHAGEANSPRPCVPPADRPAQCRAASVNSSRPCVPPSRGEANPPSPRVPPGRGGTGIQARQGDPVPHPLTPEQRALVAANIGLVGLHLRNRVPTPRFAARSRDYDDLFQEGCVALIRAAAAFDPARHNSFAAYALCRIRGVVHIAIFEHFAAIRTPTHLLKASAAPGQRPRPLDVGELTPRLTRTLRANPSSSIPTTTIRHAVRERYERAVSQALDDLARRRWPQRNPLAIMRRIAEERLLLDSSDYQTPLRQIAREAGISSGRACDYEKHLMAALRRRLAADPLLAALLAFARDDADGLDGIMDTSRKADLRQAALRALEARFATLPRARQAELVFAMIEQSAAATGEVVRNLLMLTAPDHDSPAWAVA